MALQRGALAPELAAAAEAAGVSAAAVHVDLASEESVAAATAETFAGRQVDILVRCRAGEGDKVTFTDVVTLGETMGLMKAEKPAPLAQVSSLSLGMGGSESNFAIALRRLGTSVTWVGRVGNDSRGELVLREIAAEGIVVDPLRDESAPTGLMMKERRTMDQLKGWYYRSGSAGSRLSRKDIPAERIANARLLHLTAWRCSGPYAGLRDGMPSQCHDGRGPWPGTGHRHR
ncbi:UNVERIFIED_ORG: hypothetical protein ABIB52_004130 [Arthrobacter sp. UYCu721]